MTRTRIKVCGVRTIEAARAAADSGADALGFVFVESSPRHVTPAQAWDVIGALPPFMTSVGLFANHALDDFCSVEERCPTDYAQLHGDEPEQLVRQCGPRVIKAVRYDGATIEAELRRWSAIEEVDAILVDAGAGGQGVAFDWSGLARAMPAATKPVILAGGLTPQNVGEAVRAVRPFAVDVSSGVERERGVKDAALIEAFCKAVRSADTP